MLVTYFIVCIEYMDILLVWLGCNLDANSWLVDGIWFYLGVWSYAYGAGWGTLHYLILKSHYMTKAVPQKSRRNKNRFDSGEILLTYSRILLLDLIICKLF